MQARVKFTGLEQFTKAAKDVIREATVDTVNDIARQTRTAVSRVVRRTYNVPALVLRGSKKKGIKPAIKLARATKKSATAQLRYTGKPIGLRYYGAKTKGKRVTKKGSTLKVVVKVKKKGGFKTVKGAFQHGKGKHVLMRETEASYPLKTLIGPSVPQMVKENRIVKLANTIRRQKGQRIFDSKVKFRAERKLNKLKVT